LVGKASLLLVPGFSLIFLVFGQNFGSFGNNAVDNYTDCYSGSVAHDCALSGANMAANQLFLDPTWRTGIAAANNVIITDNYTSSHDINIV